MRINQRMNMFVAHVNPHQRASTVEKPLNQKDGLGDPYYECQSAFLPMFAQWTHVQRGHGSRDGGYIWA